MHARGRISAIRKRGREQNTHTAELALQVRHVHLLIAGDRVELGHARLQFADTCLSGREACDELRAVCALAGRTALQLAHRGGQRSG